MKNAYITPRINPAMENGLDKLRLVIWRSASALNVSILFDSEANLRKRDFSLTTEEHRGLHRGAQRVSFVYLCEVLCVPLWLNKRVALGERLESTTVVSSRFQLAKILPLC